MKTYKPSTPSSAVPKSTPKANPPKESATTSSAVNKNKNKNKNKNTSTNSSAVDTNNTSTPTNVLSQNAPRYTRNPDGSLTEVGTGNTVPASRVIRFNTPEATPTPSAMPEATPTPSAMPEATSPTPKSVTPDEARQFLSQIPGAKGIVDTLDDGAVVRMYNQVTSENVGSPTPKPPTVETPSAPTVDQTTVNTPKSATDDELLQIAEAMQKQGYNTDQIKNYLRQVLSRESFENAGTASPFTTTGAYSFPRNEMFVSGTPLTSGQKTYYKHSNPRQQAQVGDKTPNKKLASRFLDIIKNNPGKAAATIPALGLGVPMAYAGLDSLKTQLGVDKPYFDSGLFNYDKTMSDKMLERQYPDYYSTGDSEAGQQYLKEQELLKTQKEEQGQVEPKSDVQKLEDYNAQLQGNIPYPGVDFNSFSKEEQQSISDSVEYAMSEGITSTQAYDALVSQGLDENIAKAVANGIAARTVASTGGGNVGGSTGTTGGGNVGGSTGTTGGGGQQYVGGGTTGFDAGVDTTSSQQADLSSGGTQPQQDPIYQAYTDLVNNLTSNYVTPEQDAQIKDTAAKMVERTQKQIDRAKQQIIGEENRVVQSFMDDARVARQSLDDMYFQRYMETRRNMANRGLLNSGLTQDAIVRLGMEKNNDIEKINKDYQTEVANYRNKVADSVAKLEERFEEDLDYNTIYQDLYDTQMKRNSGSVKDTSSLANIYKGYMATGQKQQTIDNKMTVDLAKIGQNAEKERNNMTVKLANLGLKQQTVQQGWNRIGIMQQNANTSARQAQTAFDRLISSNMTNVAKINNFKASTAAKALSSSQNSLAKLITGLMSQASKAKGDSAVALNNQINNYMAEFETGQQMLDSVVFGQ